MKNYKVFMIHSIPDIPVVYFHSIGHTDKQWVKNYLTMPVENADRFFKYITGKYQSITLKEYRDLIISEKRHIRNPIVITFDDGYLDTWTYAFPLLKKHRLKATVFVSPDFVDLKNRIRQETYTPGFLSWDEMREMEASGLIEIQSHTISHTRHFVSGKITGFHYPGADVLSVIGNIYPEKKPYYIIDPEFEKLLPYGYPIFEERSAITAKVVKINQEFIDEVVSSLKDYDFTKYRFETAYEKVRSAYMHYIKNDSLISSRETDEEYKLRVRKEIYDSKRIIEEKLSKKVEYLCWPFGENNSEVHQFALEAGYLMTTRGKAEIKKEEYRSRIQERMGINYSSPSRIIWTNNKLKAFSGRFPYKLLVRGYRMLRNDNK